MINDSPWTFDAAADPKDLFDAVTLELTTVAKTVRAMAICLDSDVRKNGPTDVVIREVLSGAAHRIEAISNGVSHIYSRTSGAQCSPSGPPERFWESEMKSKNPVLTNQARARQFGMALMCDLRQLEALVTGAHATAIAESTLVDPHADDPVVRLLHQAGALLDALIRPEGNDGSMATCRSNPQAVAPRR